ncbi:unnamed protein product [Parnassius apollo]|uniref:(apollo) hypothetical protein n=1 Tax=Parnassius apollo TaxID=110799 RepID=A0A8S3W495_PARAO|nr:unnamed protein product [Parnassius apollo]
MVSGMGPAPNQADTVAFWRSLWSEPVNHSEGSWTEVVASQCASITPMDLVVITPDDVAVAVRMAPNWKRPGLDPGPTVSRRSQPEVAPKSLHYWDHPFGS